jgi:hypothetical protein
MLSATVHHTSDVLGAKEHVCELTMRDQAVGSQGAGGGGDEPKTGVAERQNDRPWHTKQLFSFRELRA